MQYRASFSSFRSLTTHALRWLGVGLLSLTLLACGGGGGGGGGGDDGGGNSLPFNRTGLSGAEDTQKAFVVSIPDGATSVTVTTSGGTGDANLYVGPPGATDPEDAICSSLNFGSNEESCTILSSQFPSSGKLLIVIAGWEDYSGLSLSVTSAGGGGGGGGGSTTSLTGTWWVTETVVTSTCEDFGSEIYPVTIAQSGSSLTVTAPAGTFTGTLSGSSSFSWSGSYPEDGGTVTTSITGTITGSNSISGSSSWTWTDGGENCSGTTSFTATRN